MTTKKPARDDRGRIVAGGGSLNPGGVPKAVLKLRHELEKHAPHAMDRLIEMLDEDDKKLRSWAVAEVLNRFMGKPRESVDLNVDDLPPALSALLSLAKRRNGGE